MDRNNTLRKRIFIAYIKELTKTENWTVDTAFDGLMNCLFDLRKKIKAQGK